MTFDEQVQTMYELFKKASTYEQNLFRSCKKEDLVSYHLSMGQFIRNHFGLWKQPWEPEIKDGIDYSPNHPDAVSTRILETLWEKCQKDQ